jgi:hypothetical protein
MSPHLKSYGGKPFIKLRLEPQVIELLHEKFPAEAGRSGGVAAWVRGLIYRELELGEPPTYAATVSPRNRAQKAKRAPKTES